LSASACEVLVVGCGPAGAAAAIELATAGLRVTVLEKSSFDRRRIGETLAPDVSPWLARLRVMDRIRRIDGIDSPGVVSSWGGRTTVETDFFFNPYGSGRHIVRKQFDEVMAGAASEAGARVVLAATVHAISRDENGWLVHARLRGKYTQLRATWLVDATGRRASLVRQLHGRPAAQDRLVAIVATVTNAGREDRLSIEAAANGWWYFAPLPHQKAIVAFLTDGDLLGESRNRHSSFELSRSSTRLMRRLCLGSAERLITCDASMRWSGKVAGTGWIATGDAAISLDPLSGCGIWRALESGCFAAQTIRRANDGDVSALPEYQDRMQTQFATQLAQQLGIYALVPDWSDEIFWSRRATDLSVPSNPGRGRLAATVEAGEHGEHA